MDVLLKLSDTDYQKVEWIADKLGLSMSECLRSFIPSVEPPKAKTLSEESQIASAELTDRVQIVKSLSPEELKELANLLNELKQRGWGSTLAKEIGRQVLTERGLGREKYLTVGTYKRLSRWLNPYRWTEREMYVKERAERISQLLFDRHIQRVN